MAATTGSTCPTWGLIPFYGDIHSLALKTGARSAFYSTSPFGIATSHDEGESWDYHYFPKFHEAGLRVLLPGHGHQSG